MEKELRRRRWIIHRKLQGWRSTEIATALQIDKKTVYRWWSVYRKRGWAGVEAKSRSPHRFYKTRESTVTLILELKRGKHWGSNKIEGYLRNYRVQGVNPVSYRTIHRILVEAGLNNPIPTPRRVWGRRRFLRPHSNSLWQGDFKMTAQDEWVISYLDDHSRFIPEPRIHHSSTAEHAIRLLEERVTEYDKPEQILTDREAQFYSARGGSRSSWSSALERGLSILSRVCRGFP